VTRLLVLLALVLQAQQPAFKSGVDLIAVDVHVVDRQGKPVVDLKPEDFEVQIAGDRRKVASAELISYAAAVPPAGAAADAAAAVSADAPRPRRMFILAVDEHSLHISNAMAAVTAAETFIDKLQPDDLVGLYAYPTGGATHDLTSDHAAVRRAVRKITGLYSEPMGRFNLSPSEAIDIASGDREALLAVFKRACASGGCNQKEVLNEAISFATTIEMRISQSLGGLRGLVRGLDAIPGRKTLVMVSGGLIMTDRGVGRANAHAEVASLAREVARGNVSVFALHLDWSFLESLSSRSGLRLSYFRDSNMAATGLEMVAGAAGGAVFRVHGTSPDVAFDRVLRENSAHYLLGVEAAPADRDGEVRPIRVRVNRRGATVRSRTTVLIPAQK
jgi:VWFA-related protein